MSEQPMSWAHWIGLIVSVLSIIGTGVVMVWKGGKWAGLIHGDLYAVKEALHEHIDANTEAHQEIHQDIREIRSALYSSTGDERAAAWKKRYNTSE